MLGVTSEIILSNGPRCLEGKQRSWLVFRFHLLGNQMERGPKGGAPKMSTIMTSKQVVRRSCIFSLQ